MRIVVVEDEALVASRIKRMVTDILGKKLTHITTIATLEDAFHQISSRPVDLILLDLNLSGQDGFELLKTAVSGAFHTIIVSANADKAIEAFEYGVLDFVGKPFTKERLAKALARYENIEVRDSFPTRFLSVRKHSKMALIPLSDINFIKAASIYSELHLIKGGIEIHDKSLNKLEMILPSSFARIHKSYIVNVRNVRHFRSLGGSRYNLTLKNGVSLPVSRIRYKQIKDKLI